MLLKHACVESRGKDAQLVLFYNGNAFTVMECKQREVFAANVNCSDTPATRVVNICSEHGMVTLLI